MKLLVRLPLLAIFFIASCAEYARVELLPPVGSVISYFGPDPAFEGWMLADGSIVKDPESPFHGTTLPDLNGVQSDETVYLAGTSDVNLFGEFFGSGTISKDGDHDHQKTTGSSNEREWRHFKEGGRDRTLYFTPKQHFHPIAPSQTHDHGGENRPYTFGVRYLIRIK